MGKTQQIAVLHKNGAVIVHFGTEVKHLVLNPEQAKSFGLSVIKHATKAEAEASGPRQDEGQDSADGEANRE